MIARCELVSAVMVVQDTPNFPKLTFLCPNSSMRMSRTRFSHGKGELSFFNKFKFFADNILDGIKPV